MKRYKILVDIFKGFDLGEIIYPFNEGNQYSKSYSTAGCSCIDKEVIEKLPEYFEEVFEYSRQDREFLYFIETHCHTITGRSFPGKYIHPTIPAKENGIEFVRQKISFLNALNEWLCVEENKNKTFIGSNVKVKDVL